MSSPKRLGQVEFIAMTAMLFASIAFSVDTMLPGLPDIGAELSPEAPNLAQFVVTSFIFGMGVGTLLVGPLSDSFGRKPVIYWAAALYFCGTWICYKANTMDLMIFGRVLMGLGAAGPRAVGLAIVRDLYSGRDMARIMSFAMMVFSIVPAMAPLAGALILEVSGWREIFLCFIGFMIFSIAWLGIRQSETLPVERRRPLDMGKIWLGVKEIAHNRVAVVAVLVLSLSFGMLFTTLVSIQPVFDITFGIGDSFPYWFFLTSVLAMSSSIINARLVGRLGMRYLISIAYFGQMVFSLFIALATWLGIWPDEIYFMVYYIWATSIFWMIGLTIGNLNALALEPMGHIAGLASSVVSASATVLSIVVAIPIGLSFDGTPVPIMFGVFLCALCGWALMKWAMPAVTETGGATA